MEQTGAVGARQRLDAKSNGQSRKSLACPCCGAGAIQTILARWITTERTTERLRCTCLGPDTTQNQCPSHSPLSPIFRSPYQTVHTTVTVVVPSLHPNSHRIFAYLHRTTARRLSNENKPLSTSNLTNPVSRPKTLILHVRASYVPTYHPHVVDAREQKV